MSDDESDGQRASKKRKANKASRACDRCNSHHQPCDNAQPKCSVCERAGVNCTYNRPIRKRGPRTGYTESLSRLWGVVIQAPGVEDIVLQVLANGTYGDTGIPNLECFRDSDRQAELVNRFNESRIGKFIQTGELPEVSAVSVPTLVQGVQHHLPGTDSVQASQPKEKNGASRSRRPTTSGSRQSAISNPHGAPQHPGDAQYIQAEDIRRHVSRPEPSEDRQADRHMHQGTRQTPDWQSLVPPTISNPIPDLSQHTFGADLLLGHHGGHSATLNGPSTSRPPDLPNGLEHGLEGPVDIPFEFPDVNQWFESIPTSTLLNLGFTAGEGMAEDFLNLCENPEPIEMPSMASANQPEDEETVWRRLVMKGRFL